MSMVKRMILPIGLNKQVIPRTGKGLFEAYNRCDGGTFTARFDFLNKPATEIGLFRQAFLGQFGGGTKAANILAKNNMRCAFHLCDHGRAG